MKELSIEKMEMVSGGKDCEDIAIFTITVTGVLLIGAVTATTGGAGLVVAGGLSGYFGTMGVLLCGMM